MSPGELTAMKSNRSASCVAFSALSTLALVSGLWMSGCGHSEVGSAPSSKQQISDYVSQEKGQMTGKKGAGPQSIKKKLFDRNSTAPKAE
jgi:hypothetical protein